jgi:hypothetical protein
MSYQDGWAAIQLEMPACIPRTEYSAENHWDLIQAVTGAVFWSSAGERQKILRRFSYAGVDARPGRPEIGH